MCVNISKPRSKWACQDRDSHRVHSLDDEIENLNDRSPFARDRDRILYSRAFRRLIHKTQVYLTSKSNKNYDEHSRTRLTHSLEVAEIAKNMGEYLGLNADLIEAMAYGHDIGHSPFGHAGEWQLNDFLNGQMVLPSVITNRLNSIYAKVYADEGTHDFKHNFQSVRQLMQLEVYIPNEHYGLNLTYQTLFGILSHTKVRKSDGGYYRYPGIKQFLFEDVLDGGYVTVEAAIINVADEIAQIVHDICDSIRIGAITHNQFRDEFIKELGAMHRFSDKHSRKGYYNPVDSSFDDENREMYITQLGSMLLFYFCKNTQLAIKTKMEEISKHPGSQEVSELFEWIARECPAPKKEFGKFDEFKRGLVVNNFSVNRMDNKGRHIIRELIKSYLSDPRQLPNATLNSYCKTKSSWMEGCRKNGDPDPVWNWINSTGERLIKTPSERLCNAEAANFTSMLAQGNVDHTTIRSQRPDSIRKLSTYMAFDPDFRRVIADYIASMTDWFAEKEYQDLYG